MERYTDPVRKAAQLIGDIPGVDDLEGVLDDLQFGPTSDSYKRKMWVSAIMYPNAKAVISATLGQLMNAPYFLNYCAFNYCAIKYGIEVSVIRNIFTLAVKLLFEADYVCDFPFFENILPSEMSYDSSDREILSLAPTMKPFQSTIIGEDLLMSCEEFIDNMWDTPFSWDLDDYDDEKFPSFRDDIYVGPATKTVVAKTNAKHEELIEEHALRPQITMRGLSIGCGNGVRDYSLIIKNAYLGSVKWTFYDPVRKPNDHPLIQVDYVSDVSQITGTFDVIIALHSFHYAVESKLELSKYVHSSTQFFAILPHHDECIGVNFQSKDPGIGFMKTCFELYCRGTSITRYKNPEMSFTKYDREYTEPYLPPDDAEYYMYKNGLNVQSWPVLVDGVPDASSHFMVAPVPVANRSWDFSTVGGVVWHEYAQKFSYNYPLKDLHPYPLTDGAALLVYLNSKYLWSYKVDGITGAFAMKNGIATVCSKDGSVSFKAKCAKRIRAYGRCEIVVKDGKACAVLISLDNWQDKPVTFGCGLSIVYASKQSFDFLTLKPWYYTTSAVPDFVQMSWNPTIPCDGIIFTKYLSLPPHPSSSCCVFAWKQLPTIDVSPENVKHYEKLTGKTVPVFTGVHEYDLHGNFIRVRTDKIVGNSLYQMACVAKTASLDKVRLIYKIHTTPKSLSHGKYYGHEDVDSFINSYPDPLKDASPIVYKIRYKSFKLLLLDQIDVARTYAEKHLLAFEHKADHPA